MNLFKSKKNTNHYKVILWHLLSQLLIVNAYRNKFGAKSIKPTTGKTSNLLM